MAVYNSSADAANTAVRAFLTGVGELYLGRTFNTRTGQAKKDWQEIYEIVFEGKCAYCGDELQKPQIEHLAMFNRTEYGLHHPGNCVPVCSSCNQGRKDSEPWGEYLDRVGSARGDAPAKVNARKARIVAHMTKGKFALPPLTDAERNAIRVIAASLYEHVKGEMAKAESLYEQLREAFVHPTTNQRGEEQKP